MSRTVTTQAELDAAIAFKVDLIYIESDAGIWLRLTNNESSHVVARGLSHVEAWGWSHVEAYESSHVVAWESSHVEAWGLSHVEARESSHVEAYESSHVVAWGWSHVEAWGSSHVEAWGSSHVVAWESSHVVASKYVAVHLRSARVQLKGGVLIDLTKIDLADVAEWLDFHGVKQSRGSVTLYKAVDDALKSGRGFAYPIGETLTDPMWEPSNKCGGGLHLGPTPRHARAYFTGATRFLAIKVKIADLCSITDGGTAKAKARVVKVLAEVDIDGKPVSS